MSRAALTAVLGPTNTGKTHLAIERMCGHSSGIMGFPLRLLAREVYDRVRAIKGDASVALITGEEKVFPPQAKWLICTVESMPVDRDAAFVAIDEAQLGADAERGHVFTDRLLHARGREETMILGAGTLAPLIRELLPHAEIVRRPRFSQLSYAGPKKLSRLPKRSAIVAFSAEEVYGIAELIRRTHGGSAVVMGGLSPRTRNAQVAMFEAGEVDYLVATDAIGMGINLDVAHIAFASLSKFDGKRQRRLHPSEMAQIAGRAGRHQRDGTFGVLAGGAHEAAFSDLEIERIENHRFAPLDYLFWRNSALDYDSIDALIASLEEPSDDVRLRAAPEAIDLATLNSLAGDPFIRSLANDPNGVSRLWEVCGLPDFRKMGAEFHARLAGRLFQYLSSDAGVIPNDVIAGELARLDTIQGDIGTLTGRIAAARTWSYVSQRVNWLSEPAHWAMRAEALEQKLSDALHNKLTQRFVDRRTTLLMRGIGQGGLPSSVNFSESGEITLDEEHLGWLHGFDLIVDPAVRLGDRKRLVAIIERQLPKELARRVKELINSPDRDFTLSTQPDRAIEIQWQGTCIGRLEKGRSLVSPTIKLSPSIAKLPGEMSAGISLRIKAWLERLLSSRLGPLSRLQRLAGDPRTPANVRAVLAPVLDAGGAISRTPIETSINFLLPEERRALRQAGVVVGALDVFHPALLKPEATRLRLALLAIQRRLNMPPVPMPGLTLLCRPSPSLAASARDAGYRSFGDQMLRIDLVERIARVLHDQRQGKAAFAPDMRIATNLGVGDATMLRIMRALGFHPVPAADSDLWRWRGRRQASQPAGRMNSDFDALRNWGTGSAR